MHRCPSVLPEDMSAKTRVVKLCRAGVGQVRGTFAGRVRTSLGSTLVELCTVCLPLCIGMILVHVYTDGHLYLEYFSSFHRNGL